jgi:hypothetical protein
MRWNISFRGAESNLEREKRRASGTAVPKIIYKNRLPFSSTSREAQPHEQLKRNA